MSLFERLKNKRYDLQEKKDELDKIKKPTKKANKEVFDSTGKSAARDAKKYVSGEYPKIGGGTRIGSKSKGSGAETGAKVNLNPTSGSKSKGTTPVKVNITKPIKQSEVSKKAKEYTQKIDKIRRAADRSVKKQYPDPSSLQAMKSDIDTRNLIKKAGGTGDIGFTAPDRKTKVAKRTTRAIKQGTPDPFKSKTKFSQKGFEKSLKKFSKGPRTGIDNPFMKSPAGDRFKIGDTKGQMNVKAMNRKAFRKTQPKDVKLPKSFTDFDKKLKTLKTDVAKTASATPRTVTKKYKPTTTVKQSEVSKQAKDFTKKVNQARTKDASTNVFKRVTAATSGKKVTNSKGIGNKFRGKENKAAKDAMIKSQRDAAGMGGGKPPKPPRNVTFSAADFPDDNSRKIVKKVTGKRTVNPSGGTRTPRVVTKQTKALMSKQQTFVKSAIGKSLQKNLPQVYKVAKNPVVRQVAKKAIKAAPVAAIPIGLAASPYARTAIKTALLGGGLSAFKSKKVPVAKLDKEKKIGKTVKFSLSPKQKA